jgi:hypothetical protein
MLYQLPGERQCRSTGLLHRLTADFVHAVPDDKWNFTPRPTGKLGPATAASAHWRWLRAILQASTASSSRGVYNAALATSRVDWTRKREHYRGPLSREALLAALSDKQQQLLRTLNYRRQGVDRLERNPSPLRCSGGSSSSMRRSITVNGAYMPRSHGFDTPLSRRRSFDSCTTIRSPNRAAT